MLRHSRQWTLYQRRRAIKRRLFKIKNIFSKFGPPEYRGLNSLNKDHFTDCSCFVCTPPKYKRLGIDKKRLLYDNNYAEAIASKIVDKKMQKKF